MIEMLKIFERIIKGKQRILDENLKKYGLSPKNVKRFWKDHSNKEIIFVTTHNTIVLKSNWDSLDMFEFFRNLNMSIWAEDQYINISLVKSTRRYFSKRPYRLMLYFMDNTKIKLSDNYQAYSLKHLNDRIRDLMNSNSI